ncbi:hypothetical protein [Cupriavidus sp. AcVe19-6a]|uniref:hypothetical protein n=1 Tax=Cupriavidus sp. AcVe19-6a TaxID=2821358 RepID=UPI001AE67E22|nr:hypothetical protein [Cupriavidus sp. AcVe19-6a]MBP0635534.1 hypothetical protein [Cupriavidus sp. AcVe19-6a]
MPRRRPHVPLQLLRATDRAWSWSEAADPNGAPAALVSRTYVQTEPGTTLVVVCPWPVGGWQVSAERRTGLRAGHVRAFPAADAREVLAACARVAASIARRPLPAVLHLALDDGLDPGVAARAALVLLAAAGQASQPIAA